MTFNLSKTKQTLLILILVISGFSFSQEWVQNIDEAKSLAKSENKTIILVFQGSDWCAPCIKLDKEIFQTKTFKSYAATHFVMLKADFPRRKKNALNPEQQKHNKQLAEQYNKNGFFPYAVVLDENANFKGSLGYENTSPLGYIKLLESFKNQ